MVNDKCSKCGAWASKKVKLVSRLSISPRKICKKCSIVGTWNQVKSVVILRSVRHSYIIEFCCCLVLPWAYGHLFEHYIFLAF